MKELDNISLAASPSDERLASLLRTLAARYNVPAFIKADPIQFPHRYSRKPDIEISAFVTAWLSWGSRRQILLKADYVDRTLFLGRPLAYIQSRRWEAYEGDSRCLYRTFKYRDFASLCLHIYNVYSRFPDMEAAVDAGMAEGLSAVEALSRLFSGVYGVARAGKGSPCKRLCMFLRWMVRRDGIVDFGLWRSISPRDLIVPLDTHVFQEARRLGLTSRRSADWRAAVEITDRLRTVFPADPALGDFALFGLGVSGDAMPAADASTVGS